MGMILYNRDFFIKWIFNDNKDFRVAKLVIFYYLVSNMVVWQVFGDIWAPFE